MQREGEGEGEIEGERAASCWYSSAAAVPDEAAIFTHSAAFFSAGILSLRKASAPVRLRISEHTVRECTRARLLVPSRFQRGLFLGLFLYICFVLLIMFMLTKYSCSQKYQALVAFIV